MGKIRAILIDDEIHCTESLKIEVNAFCPEVEVVGVCNDPREGVKLIEDLNPDVVFLDIEMPWMSGFELLSKISFIDFSVICTTAYNQYVIKAFKFSAVDYLLKPIDTDELQAAIERVKSLQSLKFNKAHLDILINNLKPVPDTSQRIVLPSSEGLEFIKVSDIIRIESESNYSHIYLIDNKKVFLAKTLKDLEQLLSDSNFIRVHNSHIVSENHIVKYHSSDGGSIELSDGSRVPLSRTRRSEFISKYKL